MIPMLLECEMEVKLQQLYFQFEQPSQYPKGPFQSGNKMESAQGKQLKQHIIHRYMFSSSLNGINGQDRRTIMRKRQQEAEELRQKQIEEQQQKQKENDLFQAAQRLNGSIRSNDSSNQPLPWRKNDICNRFDETNNNTLLAVKTPSLDSPDEVSPKSTGTDNDKENIQVCWIF